MTGAETVGKEPPAPTDPALLKAIHTLAPFVAKMGPAFEALAVRKNSADPAFRFLAGGEGSEYYRWRVRAEKAAKRDLTGLAIARRSTPLTADDRASLLGEQALASTTAAQTIARSGPAIAQAQQPTRIGVTGKPCDHGTVMHLQLCSPTQPFHMHFSAANEAEAP